MVRPIGAVTQLDVHQVTASNRAESSSNGALLGTIERCIRCKIPETARNVQGCSSEAIFFFFHLGEQ